MNIKKSLDRSCNLVLSTHFFAHRIGRASKTACPKNRASRKKIRPPVKHFSIERKWKGSSLMINVKLPQSLEVENSWSLSHSCSHLSTCISVFKSSNMLLQAKWSEYIFTTFLENTGIGLVCRRCVKIRSNQLYVFWQKTGCLQFYY